MRPRRGIPQGVASARPCLAGLARLAVLVLASAVGCHDLSEPGHAGAPPSIQDDAGRAEASLAAKDAAIAAAAASDPCLPPAAPEPPSASTGPVEQAIARAIGAPLSAYAVTVRPWALRPGFSLALVAPRCFPAPAPLQVHVVLLDEQASTVTAAATGAFAPSVETHPAWTLDHPDYKLDLAPYEIRKGDFAFGVRFAYRTQFPAGENTREQLFLFRQEGARLVDILDVLVSLSDEQRGPDDTTDSSTVLIIVAPETTRGFRDLLLRTRSVTSPLPGDRAGVMFPKRRTDLYTERWRWAGAGYQRSD
jgi:hypothetical protein